MVEGMEGRLCSLEVLEVPEVMRCVLFCRLEAVGGGWCFLDAVVGGFFLMGVVGVLRWVRLFPLEAMEGWLCCLVGLGVRGGLGCVYSVCWRLWRVCSVCWRCRR